MENRVEKEMLKIECCRRLTTHFIWSEIREFPAVANDVLLGEVINRIGSLPLSVGRLGQRKPRFRSRMFVLVYTNIEVAETETNFSLSTPKRDIVLITNIIIISLQKK